MHIKPEENNNLPTTILNKETTILNKDTTILNKQTTFPNLKTIIPSIKTTILNIKTTILNINTTIPKDMTIMKDIMNITIEELKDYLKELMKNIKIGKIYQINGNGYNLTINPINTTNNIDLTLCEQILRKKYNIPPNEILTILQIRIDKKNEKALTTI